MIKINRKNVIGNISVFKLMVESANDAIVLMKHGFVLFANSQFFKLSGYGKDEIIGSSITSFIIEGHKGILDGCGLGGTIDGCKSEVYESKGICKGGQIIDISIKASVYEENSEIYIVVVIKDISEQMSTSAKLQKEKEIHRTIVETYPAFFITINLDGTLRSINSKMLISLGYTEDEIIGFNYVEKLTVPEEREEISTFIDYATKLRKLISFENRVIKKDGKVIVVEWHANLVIYEDGCTQYLLAFGIDITDKKKLLDEIDKKALDIEVLNASLKAVFNYSKDMIWVVDKDYRMKAVSKSLEENTYNSYGAEIKTGTHQKGLLAEENETMWMMAYKAAERKGAHFFECRTQDDRYLKIHVTPIYRGSELISFTIYANDITDIIGTQNILDSSRNMLKYILNLIPQAVFWKDLNGRYLGCNSVFAYDAGLNNEDEIVGKTDFDLVWSRFAGEYLKDDKKVAETNSPKYNFVEKIKKSNGTIAWINTTKVPMHDSSGKVFGVLGVYEDITVLKNIQAVLYETDRKLKAIFNLTTTLLGLLSPEGIVLEVNQTALDFVGAKLEDVVGMPFWETPWWSFSEENRNIIRSAVLKASKGNIVRDEATHIAADGSVHFIDFILKPVMDEAGKVIWLLPEGHDITEQKRTQKELVKNEKQYRSLFEKMFSGFMLFELIYDDQGEPIDYKLIEANQEFEKLTGLKRLETIGKTSSEISLKLPHEIIKACYGTAQSGKTLYWERYNEDLEGYFEVRAYSPAKGSVALVFNDISERKSFEKALITSEKKFREVFELSPVGIYYTDSKEKRVLEFNTAMAKIAGCETIEEAAEYLIQRHEWYVEPEKIKEYGKVFYRDRQIKYEYRAKRKDGKLIWVEVNSVLNDKDIVIGFLRDITKEKEGEDKILQLNTELEQKVIERTMQLQEANAGLEEEIAEREKLQFELIAARETAENANKYKSEFLANFSHEIRTPINAIVGFNHLLSGTSLSPKQKEYLERAKTSASSLLGIINDILDFSKIEANKIELEINPFSLRELFDSLESIFKTKANEKGLELLIKIDDRIPPVLLGDRIRLNQVLLNLLGNAIKFTQKGSVFVSSELEEYNSEKIRIIFTLRDTGIGISSDQITRLFNPFSQADTSVTREYGGTGLGLSISKRLVELMGGSIHVASVIGEGSTFKVLIDFGYSQDISLLKLKHTVDYNKTYSENKKVLLVEDNEMNQFVIRELLQSVGLILEISSNGADAVSKLRVGEKYDLILMDLHMPVMNGYEATKKIREFDLETPIIAITADVVKGVNKVVIEAGMNAYVTKPIDPNELLERIDSILSVSKVECLNGATLKQQSKISDDKDIQNFALPDQLPGINIKESLNRINGEKAKYLHMLKIFSNNLLESVSDIRKALSAGELSKAVRLAHTLKGNSASIGAYDISNTSQKIQALLEGEEISTSIEILLNELELNLSVVKPSIIEIFKHFEASAIQRSKLPAESCGIFKELKMLEEKINNKEFSVYSLFESVYEGFCYAAGKDRADKMRAFLLEFNWKCAKEIIDEAINEQKLKEE